MNSQVVLYMMKTQDLYNRMSSQIMLQCAPFLKRMKISGLMNIGLCESSVLPDIFEGTGITCRILAENGQRCLAFFYREKDFCFYLNKKVIRSFLLRYGYVERQYVYNAEDVLGRLSERVFGCIGKESEFPHEIGVLLGYPVEDVEAFIRTGGRKCLFSGYWKVYYNPLRARLAFSLYDQAKISAVNEYLAGKTFREIAVQPAMLL